MSQVFFNRGGTFGPIGSAVARVKHPLFGLSIEYPPSGGAHDSRHVRYEIVHGPLYDVTTGIEMSREGLLADPFFYDGTLARIPVEIALWAYAETANLSIAWSGMSHSATVVSGYNYRKEDSDSPERNPEEDYNRALIYSAGDQNDAPTDSAPQPSVMLASLRDKVVFTGASPGTTAVGGKEITFAEGTLGRAAAVYMALDVSASIPPTISDVIEYDTGIDLDGGTYKLRYTRREGETEKVAGIGVGPVSRFYPDYNLWSAPVGIAGSVSVIDTAVDFIFDDTYFTLLPEYGAELGAALSAVSALESGLFITRMVPVGSARYASVYTAPGANEEWGTSASYAAEVVKQFDRFLAAEQVT